MSRMWWYTIGVLVLWVVNSELRRIFEYCFGVSKFELLAIVPLLSLLPHLGSLTFGGGWRRLPFLVSCAAWIWVGGFAYALVLAAFQGNVFPGSYDFITFVLPIGIGLWIAADDAPFTLAYWRLKRTFFALATLASVYGIFQYVVAPPWDALWLRSLIRIGIDSFGLPAPFQMRVFSTTNSPGTFAFFLSLTLVLALPEIWLRKPWLVAQIPIWLVSLALTLVRTGWIMFGLGVLAYLILSPRRYNLVVALTVVATISVTLMVALPVAVGNEQAVTSLFSRFATLSNLDNDTSRKARQGLYETGPEIVADAPFGQGLGVLGLSTKLGAVGVTTNFDSGFIARFVEMGIPGAILYILPLLILLYASVKLWFQARLQCNETLQAFAAMAIALNIALAFQHLAVDASGLSLLTVWLIECTAIRFISPNQPNKSSLAFV